MRKINIALEPCVGIWWFYRNTVISHKIPYTEGVGEGDLKGLRQEHRNTWEELRKPYLEVYPELSNMSFDDLHRGRVWYSEMG